MSSPDKLKVGDRVLHQRYGGGQVTLIRKGSTQPYHVQHDDGKTRTYRRGNLTKGGPDPQPVGWGQETPTSTMSHLRFLKETLIPDLKGSGRVETAEDFERCVRIIEQLQSAETIRTLAFWLEYCGSTSANAFESAIASFHQRGLAAVKQILKEKQMEVRT